MKEKKQVLQLKRYSASTDDKNLGATAEDFEELFAKQNTELLRLSLHLTADAEKAKNCLILAMRDCLFRSSVSKDRVYAWARRMVMRSAIRVVWGKPNDILDESRFEFYFQPNNLPLERLRESVAILTLPDMDRLAFVVCVLERYSILDCALLLKKAPQEVYDAIVRATNRVLPLDERKDATAASPSHVYSALWGQRNKLEDSCGSVFD